MSRQGNRLLVIVGSTVSFTALVGVLYFAESSTDGTIKTIWDALWYALVTLTTVGYGDMYPVTGWGRVAGLALVLASLGVLSVLIGVLTDNLISLRESRRMGYGGTKFTNHVVIVGWDMFAEKVTHQLVAAHNRVCIITEHKENVDLIYEMFPNDSVFVLFSELHNQDILGKVNITEAKVLFPNLKDDARNLVYVINLRKKHPELQIVMNLDNSDLQETFANAGVNYTISKNDVSSKMLASYIFEPDVAKFNEDLLASATGRDDFDVQQYKVTASNPYLGKGYGEVFADLKKNLNVVLIGLSKRREQGHELQKLPSDSLPVEEGDYLVLITPGVRVQELADMFGVKEGVF